MTRTRLFLGLSILGATLFSGSDVRSQTNEACESAISEMGYPVQNGSFERGGIFRNDRYSYGDVVCEVSRSGEIGEIVRDGQTLAEDGIFGLGALLLRAEAEQTSANRLVEARQARDRAIEAARRVYEETRQLERRRYAEIELVEQSMIEALLQGLRNGEIDEVAALHFAISPAFLSEFVEEEFFAALRARRERERDDERARIEEETLDRERERTQRAEQRRREQAAEEARLADLRQARERILGIPVEPEASIAARGTEFLAIHTTKADWKL